eukprot:CAMPEP_0185568768 /NCGR_PEP_ID=MMETSP0434-20130131/1626_1 /TAXON_ID=626734 ORGANISM="Favella taraikaensis, Strain Fe Narragansett Bay" /NCGR_SAMPLE_ID=MMETSP0434 /ASSEMBLY_ACC=CAM_ASM_000379 /LENGTH=120 /DNA_ID=CAMNT_0028183379 /DNA_START=24 /DNA_END=386 /DNA_ORIENTATION=-
MYDRAEQDSATPLWQLGFKNSIAHFLDGGTKLALMTCCCPCVTAGQVAAAADPEEGCFKWGFFSVLPICGPYCRAKVRKTAKIKNGINVGTFWEDVAIHYSAGCCALIQEARELGLGEEA